MYLLYLVALVTVTLFNSVNGDDGETIARAALDKINAEYAKETNEFLELLWNYDTNMTNDTFNALENNTDNLFLIDDEDLPWQTYKDYDISREAKLYGFFRNSNIYPANTLADDRSSILDQCIVQRCESRIEQFTDYCETRLLKNIKLLLTLANSTDPKELLKSWKTFYDGYGPIVKPLFENYVDIANIPSRQDGFSSRAEDWLSEYEQEPDKVEVLLKSVYEKVKPLYLELHAHVRYKLNLLYGDTVVPKTGPIPSHVLGSLVSGDWQLLYMKIQPYPNVMDYTVTLDSHLKKKLESDNYTPNKMFKLVESFYTGLNLKPMTDIFWQKSLIEEPKDRSVACESSAWDFLKQDDFRIEHCTHINPQSLYDIYDLMSDVEYAMQCANLPVIYRAAPNGLDSAMSTAIRRSVKSFKYFSKIGLKNYKPSQEEIINTLMLQALYYVPSAIYLYTLDVYRRGIFSGKILKGTYNSEYWNLRETLTGVKAPEKRSDDVLDAAGDFKVISDINVNNEFNRIILSYQILKSLCTAAGQYDPAKPDLQLSQCDFSGSHKAGEIMSTIMKLGQSKPLSDVLKAGLGQDFLDGSGMVEYFNPLLEYLKQYNIKAGVKSGF